MVNTTDRKLTPAAAANRLAVEQSRRVPLASLDLIRKSEPDVYVEVLCKTTGAEGIVPRWARIKFTGELVDTLLRMDRARVDGRLDRVGVRWAPDGYGPCEDVEELRTEAGFLIVELLGSASMFYFEAREKYTQAVIESAMLDLPQALVRIADGQRYFGETMGDDELQMVVESSAAEPPEAA